ncbi:MAG: hypothetical protein CVU57_04385 [Deltaproteobacteria bacterium HGW-Deltaproteobacteria-15]|jgi:hypothetical protein|nr:MAG: hypothetical protein CVU57_04385 [Deltaproteobacteria bacterium HGW-Deltaproteobacteria-15]
MGVFWAYFRDKLRWPLIHRPGALSALVEGAAGLLDAAREDVLWLRDQFFAEQCEEVFLSKFAKSRGIGRAPLETDKNYLWRVRFAYLWWIGAGRPDHMIDVLAKFFGFGGGWISNLREEDPERWAEFRVHIDVIGDTLHFTEQQVVWAINEMKPARSKLAEIVYYYSIRGDVPVFATFIQSGEIIEVYPG